MTQDRGAALGRPRGLTFWFVAGLSAVLLVAAAGAILCSSINEQAVGSMTAS